MNLVVADAGARYGLHPTWADLGDCAQFHLFEMDHLEAERLSKKYAAKPNIRVHAVALHSEDKLLKYSVTTHRALNSLYQANRDYLEENAYMVPDFGQVEERQVQACRLDTVFSSEDVHFLKLDVEGAELEVLKGALSLLERSVLGIRAEVLFAPIYQTAPLFGEVNAFMLQRGYELVNLDYTGAGNKAGRFTLPGRYGKLLSSDAVWVISRARMAERPENERAADLVRLALFYLNNSATDLAVDLLVEHRPQLRPVFEDLESVPIVRALHRKCLMLFKSLLSVPMLKSTEVVETYATIFGREFPTMNKFYESEF